MGLYLVISQIVFVLCILPWLFVWGMSVMIFDSGFHLWNTLFFIAISLYPLAVIGCSIAAWLLRTRRKRTAIWINLIPLLWIVGIGLAFLAS